jgi:transcriptional antiterminator NusG
MDYVKRCRQFLVSKGLNEAICFQYERMMRYGGNWHLENRMLIPGYIFLVGIESVPLNNVEGYKENILSLTPCETPYLKELCEKGHLIGLSRGIIRNGSLIITSGPLKKREAMIRRIDRHKRTASIEIPFVGDRKQVTVGLEIYDKFQTVENS